MLSEEEKKEIQKEFHHVPTKQNACLDALKVVQEHRGYVSDESLKDVADFLEMSTDELESVATFYNLVFRRPVGRNVILVCDSISCWVCGYEGLVEHLKKKLNIDYGETTEDNRFTLLTIPCLGTCDRAPALMINKDLHRDLTTEKLDEILEQYE